MSAPLRLAAFVAVLALTFAAAFGVGAAVGPEPQAPSPMHDEEHGR